MIPREGRWTAAEDQLLRLNYARLGARRMAETVFSLTHPNPVSVTRRAWRLGLGRGFRRV